MIQGKEEIMRELFNIEPHQTGPGFLMRLKTGEIDVPNERGGYIVSSGCGSGKTESIKSLIRNKYNEGILYCVDTKEELDKMYNWIIDNLVDVMPGLKKEDVMIISSDDEHYISLSEYKDNPEIIMQKKILLITHVRFWTDLINYADKGWRKQYPDSYKDGNRHLSILSRAKWLCLYGVLFENAKDYLINTFGRHGISEFEIEGMLRNNYHSNREEFGSKRMEIYGRKEEGKVYKAKTLVGEL